MEEKGLRQPRFLARLAGEWSGDLAAFRVV